MPVQDEPLPVEKATEKARGMLADILRLMGFEAQIDAKADAENRIHLQVHTPEASRLIGRRAQMLETLQYLLNRMARRALGPGWACVVDVELYRERRRDKLLQEAFEVADRVLKTGRPHTFPPLHPHERRIIHHAIAGREGLETVSGEEDRDGCKPLTVRPTRQSAPPDLPPPG